MAAAKKPSPAAKSTPKKPSTSPRTRSATGSSSNAPSTMNSSTKKSATTSGSGTEPGNGPRSAVGSTGSTSASAAGHANAPSGGHRIPGVGDLLSLVGGVGPVMAAGRAIENVVGLSTQFVELISTFNETLHELNTVARRVNRLLDDIEAPIRLIVPQVERGIDQARATMKKVDGVVAQVGSLPSDVARAVGTLSDLASKLNPLAQFAETAGGIFGVRTPPKG